MLRVHRVPRSLTAIVATVIVTLAPVGAACAQFAGSIRLTNPVGRTVLELRQGTQPANPRLLFTAAITAGPTGGTTSLLLHQMPIADLFNPAVPAAGWVTVRSSSTAFSLGGGCGRNNLIDFPFINNNRPEILRITGTTQQVITLGLIGNDQYDSIDCVTQRDGRVLYMLSNRTRQRLELRREQGGLLQLVRDDFGTLLTPFAGGIRPSLARGWRPRAVAPEAHATATGDVAKGSVALLDPTVVFFMELFVPAPVSKQFKLFNHDDNDEVRRFYECTGPQLAAPSGFTVPKESAVAERVAVGPTRNDNVLWGDYFIGGSGGCTQTQPAESFGSAGPFSLFNWGGVAANQVLANTPDAGGAIASAHTTLLLPNSVVVNEGSLRSTQPSPFAGRGGPVDACPLRGTEIDRGQVAVGVGPTALQVQHSIISGNLAETLGGSSFEDPADTEPACE